MPSIWRLHDNIISRTRTHLCLIRKVLRRGQACVCVTQARRIMKMMMLVKAEEGRRRVTRHVRHVWKGLILLSTPATSVNLVEARFLTLPLSQSIFLSLCVLWQ